MRQELRGAVGHPEIAPCTFCNPSRALALAVGDQCQGERTVPRCSPSLPGWQRVPAFSVTSWLPQALLPAVPWSPAVPIRVDLPGIGRWEQPSPVGMRRFAPGISPDPQGSARSGRTLGLWGQTSSRILLELFCKVW